MLVLCCNAPRPLCISDTTDSALPVNAPSNINPSPLGPVTLNTFTLIVTERAGYVAILTLDVAISRTLYTRGWHTIACSPGLSVGYRTRNRACEDYINKRPRIKIQLKGFYLIPTLCT